MSGEALFRRYWHGTRRKLPITATADEATAVTPPPVHAVRRKPRPPYYYAVHLPPDVWYNPRRFMPRTETRAPDPHQFFKLPPSWKHEHFAPADTTVIYQYPRRRPVPPMVVTLQHTIRRIPRQRRQIWRWEAHVLPPHRGTGRRFPMLPAQLVTRYQNITWRPSRRMPWRIEHFALTDYWVNPRWMIRTETIFPQPETPEDFTPECEVNRRRVHAENTPRRRVDREPTPGLS